MGTDIHLYVERQQPDGDWQIVPPPEPPPESERTEKRKNHQTGEEYDYVSPFWGPHGCMYDPGPSCFDDDPEETERSKMYRMRWYRNRNYDVFAILTGTVRNGVGFAGCDLGDGFRGITQEPRGLPASFRNKAGWAKYASWDHSESWLGLPEVLAFDWEQVTHKRGVIPLARSERPGFGDETYYTDWKEKRGRPYSYCGDVGGGGTRVVDEATAKLILLNNESTQGVHVRVAWDETYREAADDFLAFVDQMLVPLGDPSQTRIVFGFDS